MSGRRFAYAGVVVGLAVSIWANVAHAQLRPGGAEPGALAVAAFWPLALFLALEVLSRTAWSGGRPVVVARAGVGLVAAVAAVVSYLHLHGLLHHYGEGRLSALLGPLAIDGLMAVSAAALLSSRSSEPAAASDPGPVVDPLLVTSPTDDVRDRELDPAPRASAHPVRSPRTRRGKTRSGPRGRRSDEALLGQLDQLVDAGELDAGDVTGNRLRTQLGVGAERATRLAEAWQERHRRSTVRLAAGE